MYVHTYILIRMGPKRDLARESIACQPTIIIRAIEGDNLTKKVFDHTNVRTIYTHTMKVSNICEYICFSYIFLSLTKKCVSYILIISDDTYILLGTSL